MPGRGGTRILDNPRRYPSVDPTDFLRTVEELPDQIAGTMDHLARHPIHRLQPSSSIIITGMGGSAIGGDLVAAWLRDAIPVPVVVNRDYRLPRFAGPRTLVIAVSHSGDTQETLAAARDALWRGCPIVGVSGAGGELERFCIGQGIPCYRHPYPTHPPRAALGALLVTIVSILDAAGMLPSPALPEAVAALRALRKTVDRAVPTRENVAKRTATLLLGRLPVLVTTPTLAPVGFRWKTQLNENAKVFARVEVLPEADHNDLVPWSSDPFAGNSAVVIFRDPKSEEEPMVRRIAASRQLAYVRGGGIAEVVARGDPLLARLLTLIYVGDLVSVYLALLRGVDPRPVPPIDRLKAVLAGGAHGRHRAPSR